MAETWNVSVFSKMASAVGYDADSSELIVTWRNGTRGAYGGVPEDVARELSKAPSVGQMLHTEIMPVYPYRKL